MAIATVFNCPSYSGMLYTKSNTKTPFLNSIGKALFTRSSEFPLNQAYALGAPVFHHFLWKQNGGLTPPALFI